MDKIIFVKGVGNSGKSTVIRNAFTKYRYAGHPHIMEINEPSPCWVYDWGESKVCFASAADQRKIIRWNAQFFDECKCEIAVTAFNSHNDKSGDWWDAELNRHNVNVPSAQKVYIDIMKVKSNDLLAIYQEQTRVVSEILKHLPVK